MFAQNLFYHQPRKFLMIFLMLFISHFITPFNEKLQFCQNYFRKPQLYCLTTQVYAEDCSLQVLWSRIDVFVIAHFLGFVAKALMVRNAALLWLLSITWEFTEVSSLSHVTYNASPDLVSFVKSKKRKKLPWRSITFKSFFKSYKWYQIL